MTTYAIADQVPEGCDYLTAGKEYRVQLTNREVFCAYDDNLALRLYEWKSGFHLNGGNWRRVEK